MAKISVELGGNLLDLSEDFERTMACWKELSLDEFHELHILQMEIEKIRKGLEARK